MPCTVTCRCGKATMRFDKMNPGDIETFECSKCDGESEKRAKVAQPQRPPAAQNSPYGKPSKKQREQALAQAKAAKAPVQEEEQATAEGEE